MASCRNPENKVDFFTATNISATEFDVSLIFYEVTSEEINWNLTPINFLGIFVAVIYARAFCHSFEPMAGKGAA